MAVKVRRVQLGACLAFSLALCSIFLSALLFRDVRHIMEAETTEIQDAVGWQPPDIALQQRDDGGGSSRSQPQQRITTITTSSAQHDHDVDVASTTDQDENDETPVEDFAMMNGIKMTADGIHPLDRIKVPFPIFVLSLPKSGTTSAARYFYCGDIFTAHTFANTVGTTHHPHTQMRVGHCFLDNIKAGRPPLYDCGNYKVWSDMGHPRGTPCYYPEVHGLDVLYQYYPNATFLLVTRNSTAWTESMLRWNHGQLLRKWRRCESFPKPGKHSKAALARFYDGHVQQVRDFVASHPSLTYVEVALEEEDIGQQLEDQIGVNASCFRHHNSHEKRLQLNKRFRKQYFETLAKLNGTLEI